MKRKVLLVVGALSLCLFVSACGSNSNVSSEVQETEVQETEVQETEVQETEVQETEVQETEVQETEVQETEDIYKIGETVEIKQAYMNYNRELPRVPGNATLILHEVSNGIISGHVSINIPDATSTSWIFYDWIECSLVDENFQYVEDTMGYNVGKSYDGYDNGAFQHGDDCEIAFRITNQDIAKYLKLSCGSPEGDFDIFIELQ